MDFYKSAVRWKLRETASLPIILYMRMKLVAMAISAVLTISIGVLIAANETPQIPPAGKALWRDLPPSPLRDGTLSKSLGVPEVLSPDAPLLKTQEFVSDCTIFVDYPVQALYDWMEGDEVYYAYQDLRFPLVQCEESFPFVVTHVGMTMVLNAAGTFEVQAFLTGIDSIYSSPVCPIPGDLLSVTEPIPINIPGADVYTFIIQLDQPVAVTDNYFAGIYFISDMLPFYPGIAIDTAAYLCINYNEWGYGLTDLADNEYYNFPGSIHLFSVGYSKEGTLPMARFIMPSDSGRIVYGGSLWSAELNDDYQYTSAVFEYYKSGQWWQIGEDFDGISPLRNGVTAAAYGDGWSTAMTPVGITEGNYLLRVSIYADDLTFSADTVSAYFDMLALEPKFAGTEDFTGSCEGDSLEVAIADENPVAVTFGYRYLPATEDRSLMPLNRSSYGDVDGNSSDGNHNYDGEYGEYYSAPCAVASMLKYWFDRGFIEVMQDGGQFLSVDSLVERLATRFKTREMLGTQDDNLVVQLRDYLKERESRVVFESSAKPNWTWLKEIYSGRGGTAALAVSAPFGNWLVIKEIDYSTSSADSLAVTLYDPVGGLLRSSYILTQGDSLIAGYLPNNTPYPVGLALGMYPKQQSLTYTQIATDFDGLDGFHAEIPSGFLQENQLYLIRARALDGNDQVEDNFHFMRYTCASQVLQGDADNNGQYSITDAVFVINYIFGDGPPPATVAHGDADCNGAISITDSVFIINYIFGGGPPPCP